VKNAVAVAVVADQAAMSEERVPNQTVRTRGR
jgi:hypothetical protein